MQMIRNIIVLGLISGICMMLFGFSIQQENPKVKPDKFPNKAMALIEKELSNKNLLDTVTLLEDDFIEKAKLHEGKIGEFKTIENNELIAYLDYLYVKNIILELSTIENEGNKEIRSNYLFKLSIELKNKPLSKKDLQFAYKNWQIE